MDMIRNGDHHISKDSNKLIMLIKIQAGIRKYIATKNIDKIRSGKYRGFHDKLKADGNYENETVNEIEISLGKFKYGKSSKNSKLEWRGEIVLDNKAKYHGQW